MKTYIWILIVVLFSGVIGSALWFGVISPTQKQLLKSSQNLTICDSVASARANENEALKTSLKEVTESRDYWSGKDDINMAELDSVRPKALIADSLAVVVATLQAENAVLAAASKAKTATGKKAAATTATTAKTLKGVKGQLTFSPDSSMVIILRTDSAQYISQVPKNFQGKVLIGTR